MTTQIRIYTINKGQMDEFVKLWKGQISPLRKSLGFEIPDAWVMEETNQFVWVLRYDGPEAWEEKDKAYFESPERAAMNPNPAKLIARAEEYMVKPVILE